MDVFRLVNQDLAKLTYRPTPNLFNFVCKCNYLVMPCNELSINVPQTVTHKLVKYSISYLLILSSGGNTYYFRYRLPTSIVRLLKKSELRRLSFNRRLVDADRLHVVVKKNQAIVVEKLKVKNMVKNRKLAKHIADASWSSLILNLEYKAKDEGKRLVKIDQWYASSKTCSGCGHKIEALPLQVRKWDCPNCGLTGIDSDINAARNIKLQGILKLKAEGLSVSANGGLRNTGEKPAAA